MMVNELAACGRDLAWPPAGDTGTLASDGDRDAAARVLNEAFAEGRLTADEHGERARAAYAARTWPELARLTADLPDPPDAAGRAAAGMPAGPDRCLLCALLIVSRRPGSPGCWHPGTAHQAGATFSPRPAARPVALLTLRPALGTGGVPKIAEQARAARREQIIAAGLACFARSGYHAATMADVAAEAGVSKGTPYLYFATKETLFLALHEEWDCGAGQRVDKAIAALPDTDRRSPRRVLHAVAAAIAAHVTAEPQTCQVLMEARALAAHRPSPPPSGPPTRGPTSSWRA